MRIAKLQRLQYLAEGPGQVPGGADAAAADFEQRPRGQATSSPRRNRTPTGSNARRIRRATAGTGARRSVSKSSIALSPTEAADASLATDQPSRARAERHWAADINALERADGVSVEGSIVLAAFVSRSRIKDADHIKFRAQSYPVLIKTPCCRETAPQATFEQKLRDSRYSGARLYGHRATTTLPSNLSPQLAVRS